MKTALVTINYNDALGENSRASMEAACARWGCELRIVSGPNHAIHSPASMKTLLFSSEMGSDLDAAMLLDADTVVRSDCPNPFTEFPRDMLTVVENGGARFGDNAQIRSAELHEWGTVRGAWQESVTLSEKFSPPGPDCRGKIPFFNSGMIVAWKTHSELFRLAEKICRKDLGLGWCDQTPLNFIAALHFSTEMNFADETWNYIHPECCLGPDWRVMKKFIYHFAGTCGRRELIEQVKWEV